MNNTYYLLRHGQTPYQKEPAYIARIYPDPEKDAVELTQEGRQQIEKAAAELKDKGIDAIYASDMLRTRQTAGIVSAVVGREVTFEKLLRDLHMGVYHGGTKDDFFAAYSTWEDRYYKPREGGESWVECKQRMQKALAAIDEKHNNEILLIISHGGPLALVEALLRNMSDEELLAELKKQGHLSVGELRGPF